MPVDRGFVDPSVLGDLPHPRAQAAGGEYAAGGVDDALSRSAFVKFLRVRVPTGAAYQRALERDVLRVGAGQQRQVCAGGDRLGRGGGDGFAVDDRDARYPGGDDRRSEPCGVGGVVEVVGQFALRGEQDRSAIGCRAWKSRSGCRGICRTAGCAGSRWTAAPRPGRWCRCTHGQRMVTFTSRVGSTGLAPCQDEPPEAATLAL